MDLSLFEENYYNDEKGAEEKIRSRWKNKRLSGLLYAT